MTLREELGIPTEAKVRQYTEVFGTAARISGSGRYGAEGYDRPLWEQNKIYIFAMVMSMSRKKFVYFQDHPFSASEFVEAHDSGI